MYPEENWESGTPLGYYSGLAILPPVLAEERSVENQLCELFEREEIMERQRSRVDWLKVGDRIMSSFMLERLRVVEQTESIHSSARMALVAVLRGKSRVWCRASMTSYSHLNLAELRMRLLMLFLQRSLLR